MQSVGAKRIFAPWKDPASQPLLRVEALTKRFGDFTALDRLSLDIYEGEFFALLGPSGCGKTTLLRLIAGFEEPSAGRIVLDGVDLAAVPAFRRPVNMMFQNYALFPHLSVEANIAFGLKRDGLARRDIARRVAEMLAVVKLDNLGRRMPHQLSGGQRQRVALARCLVKRPRILLLDEPLAALDKKLRDDTRFELTELQRRLGLTFIIVTHDQSEAMTLADRIGVIDRGHLMQVAPPAEIYEQPNSRWVADFIGDVNLFAGRLGEDRMSVEDTIAGRLVVAAAGDSPTGYETAARVWVAVRPEKMRMTAVKSPPGAGGAVPNQFAATVTDVSYLGGMSLYKLRAGDGSVIKVATTNAARRIEDGIGLGQQAWLSFSPDAGIVLTR